jgi:hypothetical protein
MSALNIITTTVLATLLGFPITMLVTSTLFGLFHVTNDDVVVGVISMYIGFAVGSICADTIYPQIGAFLRRQSHGSDS